MAEGAKVTSFDALRAFRGASTNLPRPANSMSDADGECQRVTGWLERDQRTYWQFQVRKRQETVIRCKEAVRMKKLFQSADGGPGSRSTKKRRWPGPAATGQGRGKV